MFTILDRYIIRKFLTTFFFILAVIMSLAVVFDVSERIDEFVGKSAPLKAIIFEYYLNFIFFYSNLFSGLITFIAVIFFTSKMAYNSEIVAILTGSVSFKRFLVPYFTASTLLIFLALFMNHFIIPKANKERLEFEDKYVRQAFNYSSRNTHIAISNEENLYFESFSTGTNMGFKFSLEKWDGNKMIYKANASSFLWDSTKNKWSLRNYQERFILDSLEILNTGWQKDTTLPISPQDFVKKSNIVASMNTLELNKYIEQEIAKGSDEIAFYELEKHQRTSMPFSAYVLTLIGVVIASKKVRGGIGLHLASGVGMCLIYILFQKTATVLATNAGLNPLIAVWIPNIIFLGFGIYLYVRAQK